MPPRTTDATPRPQVRGDLKTLKTLAPYLWPKGETTMRVRVVIAMICLTLAKVATVYVPILFKQAVDLV